MANNPYLWKHRPLKPALLNGRVQKACKRAFIALGPEITTADAAEWAYPQDYPWTHRRTQRHFTGVKRALSSIGAVPVKRVKPNGPWLWRLSTK